MIALAIISIIAAFAIPRLLKTKSTANESNAIGALRTLNNAQSMYQTRFGTYGTLGQLGSAGMVDPVLAVAVQASSAKTGYYFTMTVLSKNWWCCTARPAQWGITGERSFRITQDGVIYHKFTDDAMLVGGTPLGSK